jgi:DNA-binding CsgD family transcriptional regulator
MGKTEVTNKGTRRRQSFPLTQHLGPLFQAKDVTAFVPAVYRFLRSVSACDFASVLYRSTGSEFLNERDSRGRTYSIDFMRRYAELTPAAALALANPGVKVLPTRGNLPNSRRELQCMEFYKEVMRPQGWRHAVAMCFWGAPISDFPVVVVTVNRREGRPDFSEADIARLETIHPVLDSAVGRLLERSASRAIFGGLTVTLRHLARGLIVLDAKGRVVIANPAARRLCAASDRVTASRLRVPSPLLDACSELRRDWHDQIRERRDLRISHLTRRLPLSVAGRHVRASIALDARAWVGGAEPIFFVELEDEDARSRALPPLADHNAGSNLSRMTTAEQAVVRALAEGLSNKEIAERLGKTVDAVKFLLHSVYRRSGIPNRTRLVALVRTSGQTVL